MAEFLLLYNPDSWTTGQGYLNTAIAFRPTLGLKNIKTITKKQNYIDFLNVSFED